MLGLLPERFRGSFQPPAQLRTTAQIRKTTQIRKSGPATEDVLLTGTQVELQNALVAALLDPSALIVLTGAPGLGKTSVLAAALASVADPWLQVIQLDDTECGFEDSFKLLFTAARQDGRRQDLPERRILLVADQAETLPSGTFAYLELLTRMPGKDASVQLVIAGRPEFQRSIDGLVADRFQDAAPVHLVLPPLSEQDAWDLFHHRVSSAHARRSARRLVMMLLERSGGVPGRFDAMLQAAVASGLLKGAFA